MVAAALCWDDNDPFVLQMRHLSPPPPKKKGGGEHQKQRPNDAQIPPRPSDLRCSPS